MSNQSCTVLTCLTTSSTGVCKGTWWIQACRNANVSDRSPVRHGCRTKPTARWSPWRRHRCDPDFALPSQVDHHHHGRPVDWPHHARLIAANATLHRVVRGHDRATHSTDRRSKRSGGRVATPTIDDRYSDQPLAVD